jgi:hypothetical protein
MTIQLSKITTARLRRVTRNNIRGRDFSDVVKGVRRLQRLRKRLDRQLKRITKP